MVPQGGMRRPGRPELAMSAAEKEGRYPASFMWGIMMAPMAAVVAAEEPEMAPKNIAASVETMANPPATLPTKRFANVTSFFETPPSVMMFPARMKKIRARRGKELIPPTMR